MYKNIKLKTVHAFETFKYLAKFSIDNKIYFNEIINKLKHFILKYSQQYISIDHYDIEKKV